MQGPLPLMRKSRRDIGIALIESYVRHFLKAINTWEILCLKNSARQLRPLVLTPQQN